MSRIGILFGSFFAHREKLSRTIGNHFFDGLNYFQTLLGALPTESYLVYGGDEVQKRSIAQVLSWENLREIPL